MVDRWAGWNLHGWVSLILSEGSAGDAVQVGRDVGVLAGDDVLVAQRGRRGSVAESGHEGSQGSAGGGGEGGAGVSQVVEAESFEADLLDRRVPDPASEVVPSQRLALA